MAQYKSDSILARQPYKRMYSTFFALTLLPRILLAYAYYALPSLRPHPKWSWRMAANNSIIDAFCRYVAAVEFDIAENLKPGRSPEHWVVINLAPTADYRGLLAPTSEIQPARIGARWGPRPFDQSSDQNSCVVIHFHPGCFVLGDQLHGGLILTVQYRLASDKKSRFPAQIQDGLTVYKYVLSLGVPASQIVFSGESAGADPSITLLRYLREQNDLETFPIPRAVFLWSPWLDLTISPAALNAHRNRSTDFLSREFIAWAYKAYLPEHLSPKNPYLSPIYGPFATSAYIYFMAGDADTAYDDAVSFEREMRSIAGNRVMLDTIPYAIHGILSCSWMMGLVDSVVASMR